MKKINKLLFIFLIFTACKVQNDENYSITLCPKEIKTRAFNASKYYVNVDTEYKLGGQDPLFKAIKIDCSGLVVMCYKYAIVDTIYSLIENDMSALFMHSNASERTDKPERGDLIFMGEENENKITHVAIYDREENGNIYFIDSTEKEAENINGVTERFYKKDDKRFKSFGIMKLKY